MFAYCEAMHRPVSSTRQATAALLETANADESHGKTNRQLRFLETRGSLGLAAL